jgi:hypothetical protein
MMLLCRWTELQKEVTMLWACCPFSRNERDSSTLEELVHESMTKRLNYVRASRFKVQHLDIVEDLLDEDWMMAVEMRQGWTLSLVFVVGWSDRDVDGKD